MVRAIALDPKVKRVAKTTEEYYNVADMVDLECIKFDIFNPRKDLGQRKKAFAIHKKRILALKPLFKKLVLERNRAAIKDGYKNYFDFALSNGGVPEEKFGFFLKNVDLIIKNLNQKFPSLPENTDWYWSEYNIPDALYLATKKRYSIPDDILRVLKKRVPKIAAIIPKIQVKELKDFYPYTIYDREKKKVNIFVSTRKTGIRNMLAFIHELGHALVYLDCLEKGVDPLSKGRYWNEEQAFKTEFELIKTLFPKKIHQAWLADFLLTFCTTLFEYKIYNNPKLDFDRVYAEAHNRCHLKANQHKNPFYVLDSYFINRPACAVVISVVVAELLLEELKKLY